jgi:protein involved in ribonucleotide reduction
MHLVYFSNYSGNTKRFVEKLKTDATRIPIKEETPLMNESYVLCVPTYGAGSDNSTVPKQVVAFLNIVENRKNLIGIIGFGNTNFGNHFCKAARIISQKTGKPILDKIEIFGIPEDVIRVQEILKTLDTDLQEKQERYKTQIGK